MLGLSDSTWPCFLWLNLGGLSENMYFRYAEAYITESMAGGVPHLTFFCLLANVSDVSDCVQGVSGEPCMQKQRCEDFWVLCYELF